MPSKDVENFKKNFPEFLHNKTIPENIVHFLSVFNADTYDKNALKFFEKTRSMLLTAVALGNIKWIKFILNHKIEKIQNTDSIGVLEITLFQDVSLQEFVFKKYNDKKIIDKLYAIALMQSENDIDRYRKCNAILEAQKLKPSQEFTDALEKKFSDAENVSASNHSNISTNPVDEETAVENTVEQSTNPFDAVSTRLPNINPLSLSTPVFSNTKLEDEPEFPIIRPIFKEQFKETLASIIQNSQQKTIEDDFEIMNDSDEEELLGFENDIKTPTFQG